MLHPNSNLSIIIIDTSLSCLGHFELLTHHYVPASPLIFFILILETILTLTIFQFDIL